MTKRELFRYAWPGNSCVDVFYDDGTWQDEDRDWKRKSFGKWQFRDGILFVTIPDGSPSRFYAAVPCLQDAYVASVARMIVEG